MTNESTGNPISGAEFFRNTAISYGMDEALVIGGHYLQTQLGRELPEGEKRFCNELFAAMHETTAQCANPSKLVYPYEFEKANDRMETSHYHKSRELGSECASAIDKAINDSCYKTNFYNLDLAAMKVIHDFGFTRVNEVLAHNLQKHEYDGRYSSSNKSWAKDFTLPENTYQYAYLKAHPILIEDFTKYVRKLYEEVSAERFVLPGKDEAGEKVQGYETQRSIQFDNDRGFALAHNPEAASPYVCWQFTAENGQREFYWGTYTDEFQSAAQNYTARVLVHMSNEGTKEIDNYLRTTELSTEQNYNMIDGLRNNLAYEKSDLTDGQTHEEIRELAPEQLAEADAKPSVLEQLREAKQPFRPVKEQDASPVKKDKGGPEL